MPTERWDDERLDHLAEAVAANATTITQLSDRTENMALAVERLADTVLTLAQRFDADQQRQDRILEELRAQGERQERILDYLMRRNGETGR